MENQELQLKPWKGYPMLFTEKIKTLITDDNVSSGKSYFTLAVEKELNVGDKLIHDSETHVISEILETRPAKGKHTIEAIFQSVVCDFTMTARNV